MARAHDAGVVLFFKARRSKVDQFELCGQERPSFTGGGTLYF